MLSTVALSRLNLDRGAYTVDSQDDPYPPKGIEHEDKWLQVIVRNRTQFDMQPLATYYDTGKPYEDNAPSDARANAFSLSQFTVVGDKDADPAGALGASAFRLKLDANNNFDFSVGWSEPGKGPDEAAIVQSSEPQDACNALFDAAGRELTIKSRSYQAKNEAGVNVRFHIDVSIVLLEEHIISVHASQVWL